MADAREPTKLKAVQPSGLAIRQSPAAATGLDEAEFRSRCRLGCEQILAELMGLAKVEINL